MKSIKILCVAAGLATLTACGGNTAANNVDANASLENVDAGLTPVDTNATDLNAATDVNAVDANAVVDANATANTSTNNSL